MKRTKAQSKALQRAISYMETMPLEQFDPNVECEPLDRGTSVSRRNSRGGISFSIAMSTFHPELGLTRDSIIKEMWKNNSNLGMTEDQGEYLDCPESPDANFQEKDSMSPLFISRPRAITQLKYFQDTRLLNWNREIIRVWESKQFNFKDTNKSTDPMVLWNSWPGDESIEVLMEQLDEMG